MRRWHLFGEAGVAPADSVETALEPAVGTTAREGIEQGARATHLQLVLRGVVASSEDGLGHAIIEYRKKQDVYAVEDKLPVPGQVVLAKVMPRQVVLDNSGTYELLTLFEDSEVGARLSLPGSGISRKRVPESVRVIDKRMDADTTALAQSYRERLYQNPQSLAEVVSVNAVRENGELLGYRISPGKDEEQFKRLGFKPGDLVTGVNGIALNDPANTMRLYQTMRSASEAVFDLQRNELQLSVSVSLDSTATEQWNQQRKKLK
jgi:general secretion pathway protein C